MSDYIDIHTHNRTAQGLKLLNYRLGVDSEPPTAPFSAGVHPWDCEVLQPRRDALLGRLGDLECLAIGEIGLDRACGGDFELQKEWFEVQLEIARRRNLAVVIHSVRAHSEILSLLGKHKIQSAIFHGFIGSNEMAQEIIRKGYYLSFGFGVTSSPKTLVALENTPLSAMFLESDTHQASIEELYATVAKIKRADIEALKEIISNNYKTIFG